MSQDEKGARERLRTLIEGRPFGTNGHRPTPERVSTPARSDAPAAAETGAF